LQHLFRPLKSSSRHLESSASTAQDDKQARVTLSNEDLFQKRKLFFQSLAKETCMRADKVIHIAGSKGKGSCVEHIAAALRTSNARVGIFTSPHLHTARERIKINTDLISKADLTRIGQMTLAQTYTESWPVFFDLFLAAAVRYFGEQQVEYVVLETGIGGRYDSTNFLDNAKVGVITSISYDHMNVLGDTLQLIAMQKAGIIKPGMHVFTPATQEPEVLEVIVQQCQEMAAVLHVVPVSQPQVSGLPDAASISFSVQVQNACLALAVVQHLGLDSSSMQGFFWPCRMEVFDVLCPAENASLAVAPPPHQSQQQQRATVVLDGAHNGDSVKLFLRGLRVAYPGRHIHVLFGAGLEKCLGDMLAELSTQCDTVCFVSRSRTARPARSGRA
jgi:dihydrofolate synthase/folylpolyglutamate synthase